MSSTYILKKRYKEYKILDDLIPFVEKYLYDVVEKEELYDRDLENENDIEIFDKYKIRKGFITSKEIKELISWFGISIEEIQEVSKVDIKKIKKYIDGAIVNDDVGVALTTAMSQITKNKER
ncbi:MAG: hypothetical protein ACRC92_21600 [Peptostreptococcaceae bacterium]